MAKTQKHPLVQLVSDTDADISVQGYVGRGMFGSEPCLGITGDSVAHVTSNLMTLCLWEANRFTSEEKEQIVDALTGMCTDSMGRGVIVYFPRIKFTND